MIPLQYAGAAASKRARVCVNGEIDVYDASESSAADVVGEFVCGWGSLVCGARCASH